MLSPYLHVFGKVKLFRGASQVEGDGLFHVSGGGIRGILAVSGTGLGLRIVGVDRKEPEDPPDLIALGLHSRGYRTEGQLKKERRDL